MPLNARGGAGNNVIVFLLKKIKALLVGALKRVKRENGNKGKREKGKRKKK
ncbi:hypothetical protein [Mesomycoplasma hyopneumoniae]|uniref:hypothetical protein n=1 Tax=Mesomycoplasma hyopneumoniae TaxID=2099 RepID=UPI00167040D5|nr:hypothetical protein [Mesomycoplasma hyopneumoniae]